VTGDSKPHDSRPRESRQSQRLAGKDEPESNSQQRNRGRRSGGWSRKVAYRFEDHLEHEMCQMVTHVAPVGFPATNRADLATMPPIEVARTETRILLCDQLHEGPHIWPNGDLVPDRS